MRHRAFALTLACLAALLGSALSGCGGSGGTAEAPEPRVFFINTSPDAGAVDFLLNGSVHVGNLAYLGRSATFDSIPFRDEANDSSYDVTARTTGGVDEIDVLATEFARDTDTVLALIGQVNAPVEEAVKRARLASFGVDRQRPIGNRARLIVLHAFSRAPGLLTPSIRFENPGNNPQYSIGEIPFREVRTIEVDQGDSSWVVERQDADGNNTYASANVTLVGGAVYLVVVSGIEGDPNFPPQVNFYSLPTR